MDSRNRGQKKGKIDEQMDPNALNRPELLWWKG